MRKRCGERRSWCPERRLIESVLNVSRFDLGFKSVYRLSVFLLFGEHDLQLLPSEVRDSQRHRVGR